MPRLRRSCFAPLEEHSDSKLNISRQSIRSVPHQSSKVRVIRLTDPIKLKLIEVPDIERQGVTGSEALRQRHMEKVQRQTARLRTAGPRLTCGVNVGSDLRQLRGAR